MTAPPRLALFDLDNTLLTGDTDVLWCEFLLERGVLDASFAAANADMDRRYRAGDATSQEFCALYVSALTGMSKPQGELLRGEFFRDWIQPRIPADARALVDRHRDDGDILIMTTATNRFITDLTAHAFGIEHLIATDVEEINGVFTGKTLGVLNMREGKVTRLTQWLQNREWPHSLIEHASFYSDSINDLPLLSEVANPVAVDPDARLAKEVEARSWQTIKFDRSH